MNLVLLWGIRLGILLLLFTPLIHWRDTVFPWVVPKAIWSRSLIEAVFAMWVVLAIRRPEYRPRRSWLVLIFALLVLAALIAAFFGVSFQRSFWSNFERMQGVFDLLHWGVLLFVLIWTVRGVRQWRLILNGMVAMGFAVGLLGIAQRLGGSVPLFRLMGPQERLDITLGNPTYVGGYMVTVCMIALGLLADSLTSGATATWLERRGGRSRARGVGRPWNAGNAWPLRVYRAATAVLAVWVIGETGSRGALAALVGGIFFAGLLYAVWGRGARLRAAAAAVAAAIVVVVPLSLFARQSPALQALGGITPVFERTFGEAGEGAAAERSVGARMALEAFAARPVSGWGGENFSVPFYLFARPEDFVYPPAPFDRAHSQPLDVLASMGIVGFVPYAALWAWLAWLAVSAVRRGGRTQALWVFGAAALGAYFVGTLFLFDTAATFLQFILIAAWAGSTEPGPQAATNLGLPGDVLLPAGADAGAGGAAQTPARRRGRRERRREARARPSAPGLRTLLDEYAVPVAVATLLAASLYALNWRPLVASRRFTAPTTSTVIAERYRAFPQLATWRRLSLIESLTGAYPLQPTDQRAQLVRFVDEEGTHALRAEPESILVHKVMADFFRTAAEDFPELMASARAATGETLRLGPHTHIAHEAAVELALAERDLEAARAAVAVWKGEHPSMDWVHLTRWDYALYKLERELAAGGAG